MGVPLKSLFKNMANPKKNKNSVKFCSKFGDTLALYTEEEVFEGFLWLPQKIDIDMLTVDSRQSVELSYRS